ncbi:EAL domain-containing protein [Pseudofrankia sp. DC12]|uniref:EAL domain-containing protein n=1 Tax=Pseudofrankia sp. DC12 TaxID=683315 RepID=UPI000A6B7EE5|nr:EAL domain-containing protein [Pseudofrankia sp. DC12]
MRTMDSDISPRPTEGSGTEQSVLALLSVARHRLGMEVSWLDRRTQDHGLVTDLVDAPGPPPGIIPGFADCSPGTTAGNAMHHREPFVVAMADRCAWPDVRELASRNGARAYAGAPVVLCNGSVYGILGCASRSHLPVPRDRDAHLLALLAGVLADCLWPSPATAQTRDQVWLRVQTLIDDGGPDIVYQPVYDVIDGSVAVVEALSRFPAGSGGPEQWFLDAESVGLGRELETAAVRNALRVLPDLPAPAVLSVNASPSVITSRGLADLFAAVPAGHLAVEVTEHARIDDYATVRTIREELRGQGIRIALDDFGAGYCGLQRMLELRPDYVKIDRALISRIDVDPAYEVLARAVVTLSREIGALVIAEGIETAAQLDRVSRVGIRYAQGFHLARPSPRLVLASR